MPAVDNPHKDWSVTSATQRLQDCIQSDIDIGRAGRSSDVSSGFNSTKQPLRPYRRTVHSKQDSGQRISPHGLPPYLSDKPSLYSKPLNKFPNTPVPMEEGAAERSYYPSGKPPLSEYRSNQEIPMPEMEHTHYRPAANARGPQFASNRRASSKAFRNKTPNKPNAIYFDNF
jgi:hypothetical protein